MVLVIVAKFGISANYNIIYVAHGDIFPVLFSATAFGFCSFFARLFTSLSPLLAEIEEPAPMIAFTGASFFAAFAAVFLVKGSKDVVYESDGENP